MLAIPAVQTKLGKYATKTLNKDFGTNLNIEKLKVSLLSWNTSIKGIYAEDFKKDTLFYINDLTTSVLSIRNLVKGKLEFGDIEIDQLHLKLKTYEGTKSSNLEVFVDKLDDKQQRKPGTPPFFMSSSNVKIKNSKFQLIDENTNKPQILKFKELDIDADDFQILGPDVTTQIKSLSFDSRRGPRVNKLTTAFTYTKQQMRFDTLSISTPKSSLAGNLVFNYNRKDFKDFLNKVQIAANFQESVVDLDEISFLYDEFGSGKVVNFSTEIDGVLNNLNTNNLLLHTDDTAIRGDYNFVNLFTLDAPFVLNADITNITSGYYELRSLLPNVLGNLLPSSFQKLGQFTIRGDAKVTETSIDAKVNINTAIGSSYADLQITNIQDIEDASYHGFVSLIDFNLAQFLGNQNFGKTSLDINVDGRGFNQKTMNTEITGEVYNLYFNDYNYKDIKILSGILKEQFFDGSLVCKDENLKFNFSGIADFSEYSNDFNFSASVDYADFNALNFIKDSISVFKGDIKMDIRGKTLDDIAGSINFTDTNYQNKNDTYYFEDFEVTSSFQSDSVREITVNSPDIINGYLKGKFKLKELGKLAQNSVGSIYDNYKPFEVTPNQNVNFKFNIYNKIVEVFLPEVKFGANTFIRGNIIADEGDFKLTFKSPAIEAYGNKMNDMEVKLDNNNPLFKTFISIADASTSFYDVRDFKLINTSLKDTLFFRTEFEGGRGFDDKYNLNFYHTFNADSKSVIGLKTSDLNFKGNTWVINKDGNRKNKVVLNKTLDSITIEEIVMNNGNDEQIRLRGKIADSTQKDLSLQFKIVSLDKITPEIDNLKLGGEVDGIINIVQKDNVYFPSSNLNILGLKVNDSVLGDLSIGFAGNRDLSSFVVDTRITKDNIETFSVFGNVFNDTEEPRANLLVNFDGFQLEPFSPLGEGVVDKIRGKIYGNVQVKNKLTNPDFNGELRLNNAGIAIPILNIDYDFANNSKVVVDTQSFNFDAIQLTDNAYFTNATLDGAIRHKTFGDWVLDLNVDTNNNRFLLLNTEFKEGDLYYGTGFLSGTGSIKGSTNALTIEVNGITARGTSLKIPISDVTTIGDYSFINFIHDSDKNEETTQRVLNDYQGLELVFDLDVTPDAEVEIIIDPKTKSSLKGTGGGTILMEINTNGKFRMNGEFAVATGEYNYKFGGFIDKKFDVRPGGSIIWEGEPLDANINMEAVFSLDANPAPLLDNSAYTSRIPVDVVVQLTDKLELPDVHFEIEFPGVNSTIESELEYRLQDPTVESKNAFSLLAQGAFLSDRSGVTAQSVAGNIIGEASGSLISSILGSGSDKFDLGFVYEQGILDPNADYRTENRVGVTITTRVSDRILVNGKFGVPVGGVSETVVAGDVEVQVLLNDDGTLRATIFNKENEIQQFFAERQGYTQGIGLSYQVDYNSLKELFAKIFKKKKKSPKRNK